MKELIDRLGGKYVIMGHLTFVALLIYSVLFYKERVLHMDSAYQVFQNLNFGMLINDGRYGMFLSQLLPLLLVKLHAPLQLVLCSYSVSFVLIMYAFFLATIYLTGNKMAGLLMVFTIFCVNNTFYHCISETFQLMIFAPFLFAWLNHKAQPTLVGKVIYYVVMLFAMFMCVFIHPIALFFVLFILLYNLLCNKFRINNQLVVCAVMFVAMIVAKNMLVQSGHDASFVPTKDELFYAVTHFFSVYSYKFFVGRILNLYLAPILIFLITSVFYFRSKNWLKLVFYVGFIFCFFAMSVIVYYKGDGGIGMERSFLPLLFFACLPFVCEVVPTFSHKTDAVFTVVALLLLLFSFAQIKYTKSSYSEKFVTYKKVIELAKAENHQKYLIKRGDAEGLGIGTWGTGLESLMYSAMKDKNFVVSFFVADDDDLLTDERYSNADYYLSVPWWRFWRINELNPHYFKLPSQPYRRVIVENGELKAVRLTD